MTGEVGTGNVSGLGSVRRNGSELEVGQRCVREALNFDTMSLPRIGVGRLGRTRNE